MGMFEGMYPPQEGSLVLCEVGVKQVGQQQQQPTYDGSQTADNLLLCLHQRFFLYKNLQRYLVIAREKFHCLPHNKLRGE